MRAVETGPSVWEIVEQRFAHDPASESLFAVANGYFGLRGTPEEGTPAHDPGAILNGLHETWPIVYPEDAYFQDACTVDLLDRHRNTADGIHSRPAAEPGYALVAGFGGLRDFDGELRFHPRLPAEWERPRFRIQIRGQLIEVDMTHEETAYRLVEGRGIMIQDAGEQVRLTPAAPVRRTCRPDARELPRAA